MRIAVYCSARRDIPVEYHETAAKIGRRIGTGGHTLIYGGLPLGLMDVVSRMAKESGAKIVGIVPVTRASQTSDANDETIFVADLNERKSKMITLADLFVTLPGGYGTLDELMATLAFLQFTSNNTKQIILVNIGGLFNPLIKQLEQMAANGLMEKSVIDRILIADTTDACCETIDRISTKSHK